ncbi:hypothetical protein VTK26DRAFT_1168 [Humicola hyalothermophila]
MPHVHFAADDAGDWHRHRYSYHDHLQPWVVDTDLAIPDFRFCVELGLVIRSRRRDHTDASSLEEEISSRLTRAGIPNHIARDRTTIPLSSHEWTIAPELCIRSRPRDHHFGMRLVSPFLRFCSRSSSSSSSPSTTSTSSSSSSSSAAAAAVPFPSRPAPSRRTAESWQSSIRDLLAALNKHFELTTTHQCYTHVHVVPSAGYWTLRQAQSLAKSALYFERCLDALVPPYRRRSVWAKSNRHNRYFAGLSMDECFARVDAQASFEALGARMNWCSGASPTGAALRDRVGAAGAAGGGKRMAGAGLGEEVEVPRDFEHDGYRWNFMNLSQGAGFGTIEFRQPPGSTSAEEAITWVMLVGCLARLSCGPGATPDPAVRAQLKSLGEWLVYEAEWSGMPNKRLLKELVKQAAPVTAPPGTVAGMDADVISVDEGQRLRWKLNDRNIAAEKYRRMLKID